MDNSPTPRDDTTNIVGGVAAGAAHRWRPSRFRLLTAGVVIAVVAAFLAGVATNGHLPSPVGPAPVRGGSIVDAVFLEADSLLPLRTNSSWGLLVDQALWAPLWYGDDQGMLHAGIADLP